MDIFEVHHSKKKVRCKICECWLPSNSDHIKTDHINGKSHKQKCEFKEKQNLMLLRSVYVRGFDPLLKNLESRLESLFDQFGGKVKDIYVDKNSGKYCFVEFEDKSSVTKVLLEKSLVLEGKKLHVKARMSSKKIETKTRREPYQQRNEISCSLPDDFFDSHKNIKDQMSLLKAKYELSEKDFEMRSLIAELLQSFLEEAYPNCKVHPFGSSVNGLGMKQCDLDITVCGGAIHEQQSPEQEIETIKEMRDILERFAPGFKNIFVVESLKNCSIIKMHHTESQLKVDLSLNNRLALSNTNLLKCYADSDQNLQGFFFALRLWAKLNNLIGRNGSQLTNYAFTLLIIHFLQQNSYLYCLQGCHEVKEDDLVGEWNCAFCQDHPALQKQVDCFGELFVEFFKFYSESLSNAKEKVFGIRTTKAVKRYELHPDLSRTEFIIQDPFKLSHNVSQNVNQSGLDNIHQLFKTTYQRLVGLSNEMISLRDILKETSSSEKKSSKKQQQQHQSKTKSPLLYIIPLPKQTHQCSNVETCAVSIQKFLGEVLQMEMQNYDTSGLANVSAEPISRSILHDASIKNNEARASVLSSTTTAGTNTLNESTTIGLVPDDSTPSKKRKAEMMEDKIPASKKARTTTEEDMVFTCVAHRETWLSRRKMRRQMNKQGTRQSDDNTTTNTFDSINKEDYSLDNKKLSATGIVKDNVTVDIETNSSARINNELNMNDKDSSSTKFEKTIVDIKTDNNVAEFNGLQKMNKSSATTSVKLEIEFTVSKVADEGSSTESGAYQLCLKLVKGDLKSYQTFFAFFKKEIVNVLSSDNKT